MVEKRLAEFCKIVLPADVVCDLNRMREWRCIHQFEVLLVLTRRACGDFVDPLSCVAQIDGEKFREAVKEVIVGAGAGGWNKGAHRERVDERIVEVLIFESARNWRVSFAANGMRRDAASHRRCFEKS